MPRHHLLGTPHGRDRPPTIISPSILSADFARLADECARMVALGAEWLHVDVMDGHFVPNLTIGHPVVASLRQHTKAFIDCHLMVANPEQWVEDFAKAGADMFTFHLEAVDLDAACNSGVVHAGVMALLHRARSLGMYAGIALKPSTPVESVFPYADAGMVDMVLILTVEPGFGGQKFMSEKVGKCGALRQRYPSLNIQVDGGVAPSTVADVAESGANVLVAGSAIFGAKEPGEAIATLRAAVDTAAGRFAVTWG